MCVSDDHQTWKVANEEGTPIFLFCDQDIDGIDVPGTSKILKWIVPSGKFYKTKLSSMYFLLFHVF
jgi:hypothetical protein